MEVIVREFTFPRRVRMVHLEPLGDVHVGSRLFMRDKFLERIEAVRRDRSRIWIGMGDYIDNVRPYARGVVDKRWNYDIVDRNFMTPEEQAREFVRLVRPIAKKCVGLLWGNHEWKTFDSDEFRALFCERLGVPFLGSMAFVLLVLRREDGLERRVTVWACHGSYAGVKRGGAVNRLEELSAKFDADIYLHAHTHLKDFFAGEGLGLDEKGNLIRWRKMYVLTGTFMADHVVGVESHYDQHPLPRSVRVGTVTVGIDLETGKLHAFE